MSTRRPPLATAKASLISDALTTIIAVPASMESRNSSHTRASALSSGCARLSSMATVARAAVARIVERTWIRIASKLAPSLPTSSTEPARTGRSKSPLPSAATALSSLRSGARRSICTTTTMKSMATRITANSSTTGCHATGVPVTGEISASVYPAPMEADATAT